MREWILTWLAHPAIAAAILALGIVGILAEFLRPGRVIPLALGGLLFVLGLWALLPQRAGLAIAICGAMLPIAIPLLYFALLARRNKTNLE